MAKFCLLSLDIELHLSELCSFRLGKTAVRFGEVLSPVLYWSEILKDRRQTNLTLASA